jgi:hypothetical protein
MALAEGGGMGRATGGFFLEHAATVKSPMTAIVVSFMPAFIAASSK